MPKTRSTSTLPVVVGVDGSEKDWRVLAWAAAAAERSDADVEVVFAIPVLIGAAYYDLIPLAELHDSGNPIAQAATDYLREGHPHLAVTSHVLLEDPASALVGASERASLVVVGARGLGRIAGRLLGSVSQKVAAHATCPVVVVRDRAPAPDGPVVVGVEPDGSEARVLQFAFTEAERRGVGLCAVHAHAPPERRPDLRTRRLDEFFDSLAEERAIEVQEVAEEWSRRHPGVPMTVRIERAHPVEALVEGAAAACMVVVGARTRGGLDGYRLGAVCRGVLHEAPVVAVVRTTPAPDEPRRRRPATST